MNQEERAKENGNTDAFTREEDRHAGMSKRELMAALMMAGTVAVEIGPNLRRHFVDKRECAENAVESADALLLALEQVV